MASLRERLLAAEPNGGSVDSVLRVVADWLAGMGDESQRSADREPVDSRRLVRLQADADLLHVLADRVRAEVPR